MSVVIEFDADGQATAMHRDNFPLSILGKMQVKRASDIRFNELSQLWDIWLMRDNGQEWLCSDAQGLVAYDVARSVEVAWLDNCMKRGLDPKSECGVLELRHIRNSILL